MTPLYIILYIHYVIGYSMIYYYGACKHTNTAVLNMLGRLCRGEIVQIHTYIVHYFICYFILYHHSAGITSVTNYANSFKIYTMHVQHSCNRCCL